MARGVVVIVAVVVVVAVAVVVVVVVVVVVGVGIVEISFDEEVVVTGSDDVRGGDTIGVSLHGPFASVAAGVDDFFDNGFLSVIADVVFIESFAVVAGGSEQAANPSYHVCSFFSSALPHFPSHEAPRAQHEINPLVVLAHLGHSVG